MTEPSLPELEAVRERLYAQLTEVGDFRRGSVSENYRSCGKPNCACAQPDHPGHGPRFLWTRTARGRGTVGRQLAAGEVASTVPPRSTTGRRSGQDAATSSGFAIETSGCPEADGRPLHGRSADQCHCRTSAFWLSSHSSADLHLDRVLHRPRLVRKPSMDDCPYDGQRDEGTATR